MRVKPNPRYDAFLAGLQSERRLFRKWRGVAFRASPLEFARVSKLLDGRGSLKHGGRWSAGGTFRAVNLSTSEETAIAESGAKFSYYNLRGVDVSPKVLVAVRLKLSKVVNVMNPRGISRHPWFQLDELLSEDWRKVNDGGFESHSQAFGRAAHDLGAEGILAPSARVPGGANLIYFPESIVAPAEVEILGEDDLTRWLKKR